MRWPRPVTTNELQVGSSGNTSLLLPTLSGCLLLCEAVILLLLRGMLPQACWHRAEQATKQNNMPKAWHSSTT
jgi:hypothetical protein